ncbi:hypothetical protein HPP92_026920 [Vanilla planifolia]|uniref:Uncharacterized protein n=1 Tax=Vanilla planifolia TaxID=51239 RepID=A0A835PHK2_VANPL|nr:hypothetical protein HPP92_026920 [Vanilla planifolia]
MWALRQLGLFGDSVDFQRSPRLLLRRRQLPPLLNWRPEDDSKRISCQVVHSLLAASFLASKVKQEFTHPKATDESLVDV